jgi:vacuolar protein sorting-associated protein 13A/C
LDVRADGYRQVLRIAKYEPQHSVYKLKKFSDRASSVADNMDVFEAKLETALKNYTIQLDLAGIGISLLNRKLVEVIYMTASDLKFEFTDTNVSQAITLSVGSTQVDNQLHDAIFPVILQPTPIDRMLNGQAPLPTIQGSAVWLKDQGVFTIVLLVLRCTHFDSRTWSILYKILLNPASSVDH